MGLVLNLASSAGVDCLVGKTLPKPGGTAWAGSGLWGEAESSVGDGTAQAACVALPAVADPLETLGQLGGTHGWTSIDLSPLARR